MKRSEFVKEYAALLARAGADTKDAEVDGLIEANHYAENRGVTWDPEEPEVLWEVGPVGGGVRLVRKEGGGDEWQWEDDDVVGWIKSAHDHTYVYRELARRILAERQGCVPLCEEKIRSLEQQLSAQKQIEESLRQEIRRLKDLALYQANMSEAVSGNLRKIANRREV